MAGGVRNIIFVATKAYADSWRGGRKRDALFGIQNTSFGKTLKVKNNKRNLYVFSQLENNVTLTRNVTINLLFDFVFEVTGWNFGKEFLLSRIQQLPVSQLWVRTEHVTVSFVRNWKVSLIQTGRKKYLDKIISFEMVIQLNIGRIPDTL